MTRFYANGKLLISGEYLVLDGASALALPLRLGQEILATHGHNGLIHWKAYDPEGAWLEVLLERDSLGMVEQRAGTEAEAVSLIDLLSACRDLAPAFLSREQGWRIRTNLGFRRSWGLGSSSTLVSLLSRWSGADAFSLLGRSFGGSGYDIACATEDRPLIYRLKDGKPAWEEVELSECWKEVLFVYSGRKQDSREAMRQYRRVPPGKEQVSAAGKLSEKLVEAASTDRLIELVDRHERLLSKVLDMPMLKESRFPDFQGAVKSLGAWGGDFFMAVSEQGLGYSKAYFRGKGYGVMFPFEKLAKSKTM